MSLALISLCLVLGADEPLDPQKAALVELEQEKAQAAVAAKYGNKKTNELTREERVEMVKEQVAADKAVLEKHGVDPKQWARESMKKDRAGYAEGRQQKKDLVEKEKAAALKKAEQGDKPITIQKGISEENPVTLEEKANEDGMVSVEKGISAEAEADQAAAAEQDKLEGAGSAEEAPRPAPKSKSGKGSRQR